MDPHFRAFSFVDRITSANGGNKIRGCYTIPSGLKDFPSSLAGEAVGQLAAWAAMAAGNFENRPVAGLAGSIEMLETPSAGQVLELAADLEHVDAESVQYRGAAHLNGKVVIRLEDCVGPMVTVADFDDPNSLRNRYKLLCGNGAEPGAFPGLPPLKFERTEGQRGQSISAVFQVPAAAPLFADHFPRRPVFPGSLLMHLKIQLGAALASELPPPDKGKWTVDRIQDMKLRSWIPPGAVLRLDAKLKECADDSVSIGLEARAGQDLIATAGLALKTNC